MYSLVEWSESYLSTIHDMFLSIFDNHSKQYTLHRKEIKLLFKIHFESKKNNAQRILIFFAFQLWHCIYIRFHRKKPNFPVINVIISAS